MIFAHQRLRIGGIPGLLRRAAVLACLIFACSGGVAAATSPLQWSSDLLPIANLSAGSVTAASCPSATFCVAIDRTGNAYFSREPDGGRDAWTVRRVLPRSYAAPGLYDIDCPSTSLCVATGDGGMVLTSTDPEHGPWILSQAGTNGLANVECPSPTLCVAANHSGSSLQVTTNPTGGAAAWTEVPVEMQVAGLSCPAVDLCVGVSQHDQVLSSTNPSGGAGAWKSVRVEEMIQTERVSCATKTLCVITGLGGSIATSTDPTGPAEAWKVESFRNSNRHFIHCATETLCLATETANGYLHTALTPTAGISTWTRETVAPFRVLECVGAGFCLGVDGDRLVTSRNPAAGAATWTRTSLADLGTQAVLGVACLSATRCLAIDDGARVLRSSGTPADPWLDWTPEASLEPLGADMLTAIACTTTCVAGDASGGLFVRDGAGTWRRGAAETGDPVWGVACASERHCVAVDDGGRARRFDGTAWRTERVTDAPLNGVACPSASLCVAVDDEGRAHIRTAAGWTARTVSRDDRLLAVACPHTGLCVVTDEDGDIRVSLAPEREGSWRAAWENAHDPLYAVTCPSASLCVATGADGGIHTASDPVRGEWESYRHAGGTLLAVSCAGDALCVAVNEYGYGYAATGTGFPFSTAAPAIPATARIGETLTCAAGAWRGATGLSFQWEFDARDAIPDAASRTFTVPADAEGRSLNCRVSAVNTRGTSVARSGGARVATPPLPVGELALFGQAEVGYSLRCAQEFTGAPPLNVTYAWTRDGLPVAGWVSSHMLFGPEDAGHTYTCSATGTNDAGTRTVSSPTLVVAPSTVAAPPPLIFPLPPFAARIEAKSARLATLRARGLPVTLRCTSDCMLTVRLVPDAATARKLGLKRGAVLGSVRTAVVGGRAKTVRVKLNTAARRAVTRAKVRSLRLKVSATDAAARPVTGARTLTIRS